MGCFITGVAGLVMGGRGLYPRPPSHNLGSVSVHWEHRYEAAKARLSHEKSA